MEFFQGVFLSDLSQVLCASRLLAMPVRFGAQPRQTGTARWTDQT